MYYRVTLTEQAFVLVVQDFELETILSGHDGYVNSLEFIPPDEECQCKPSIRPYAVIPHPTVP